MPEITFYATEATSSDPGSTLINHESGSGIGFFGGGFGVSVPIGGQQDTTWLTNGDGTSAERIQLHNTKFVNSSGVSIDSATAVDLPSLPNNKCPLNIRFTNDDPVRVQNCRLRIFDRVNIQNHASGVATFVYEARHPSSNQAVGNLDQRGRTEDTWFEFDPVEPITDMPFTSSPGASGLNTNTTDTDPALGFTSQQGVSHSSDRHDWYVALSAQPDSIGSKSNYALYFSLEYL